LNKEPLVITQSGRQAKDALFDALASVAKAMASGRRAEIVELLSQGERTVDEIAAAIDQTVANTSHHLRTLARAGLVRTRREGTWVHYSLASGDVAAMWSAIRRVAAQQVTDIEQLATAYVGDRGSLATIDREELRQRIKDGTVVVVDVRPAAEHAAGRIAGALNVPIDELARRLDELPADATVVAYCRGPYCVYADDAVRLLTRQGRAAVRLEDGFPEWRSAGLPVEVG
jgi:rhodanese-related sulfurtransferase/DNA-binding transcriptional ArsR family regulator